MSWPSAIVFFGPSIVSRFTLREKFTKLSLANNNLKTSFYIHLFRCPLLGTPLSVSAIGNVVRLRSGRLMVGNSDRGTQSQSALHVCTANLSKLKVLRGKKRLGNEQVNYSTQNGILR